MNFATQFCGIVLISIIIYSYCSQRKIKLYTARAFIGLCSVTLSSLILDAASIVAIYQSAVLPLFLVQLMCKAYVASLVWVAAFGLRYTMMDMYRTNTLSAKGNLISILIGGGGTILIYSLPIRMFHNGSEEVYTYGPSVMTTYIMVVGVLIIIGVFLGIHGASVTPKRRGLIVEWMGIWLLAAVIQFFHNELLLVGFANALGILIIYLNLENPEKNLDSGTGLFNMNAFHQYIRQLQGRQKDVSIIDVCVRGMESNASDEAQDSIKRMVADFLMNLPGTLAFYLAENEYLLVVEEEKDAWEDIRAIETRFAKPWGRDELRVIPVKWLIIPTTEIIYRSEDLLQIFQYGKQQGVSGEDGKGVVIDSDMIRELHEERRIEDELVTALQEGRVEVFYQPIYAVKENVFHSAEALVRIRDKSGDIVPPGKFIPVAETKGLIIKLGEMVFEQVCRFISEEKPYEYGMEYIEVNLSVIQCAYEHLADDFIAIMKRYDVNPNYIVLEITESASVLDKEILLENMEKLRSAGVRFALDDFGTGQSNLNYVVEMPVDVVKFDRSMTNAYFENGTAKYVMDAAMQMIQGLNLKIVSEGVEEKDQYLAMADLGIDFIQGYYFSRPVEMQNFLDFIKEKYKEQQSC